jgi:hypothetical protein
MFFGKNGAIKMRKNAIKLLMMLGMITLIGAGCMEQYAGNSQLSGLYRVLNYDTTFKERTLFFEMENHADLARGGKFYIMGAGISNPGSYTCSESENLLSAIEKAGQSASFSEISFTLVKGIRENEKELKGIVMASATSATPKVEPGDLICLNTTTTTVALSQK